MSEEKNTQKKYLVPKEMLPTVEVSHIYEVGSLWIFMCPLGLADVVSVMAASKSRFKNVDRVALGMENVSPLGNGKLMMVPQLEAKKDFVSNHSIALKLIT